MRLAALAPLSLALSGLAPAAQDLEPRRWTHLPVGTNIGGLAYANVRGDVFFDPVLQLEDVTVETNGAAASYVRAFAVFGLTGRLDLIVPWQRTRWEGLVSGVPDSRTQEGFDDPWVRLSVGLVGAPALSGKEFLDHHAARPVRTVVGAGLGVKLPLGEYDPDRLLNIGQNRFVLQPQVGAVHFRGPWSYELTGSTFLFADNDDFFGGSELEQDPIYALQAHVVHTFENQSWVSAGAGYNSGGETRIDGKSKDDERVNVLAGLALGLPIGRSQGLKVAYLRSDARESVGSDVEGFFVSWTIRF